MRGLRTALALILIGAGIPVGYLIVERVAMDIATVEHTTSQPLILGVAADDIWRQKAIVARASPSLAAAFRSEAFHREADVAPVPATDSFYRDACMEEARLWTERSRHEWEQDCLADEPLYYWYTDSDHRQVRQVDVMTWHVLVGFAAACSGVSSDEVAGGWPGSWRSVARRAIRRAVRSDECPDRWLPVFATDLQPTEPDRA